MLNHQRVAVTMQFHTSHFGAQNVQRNAARRRPGENDALSPTYFVMWVRHKMATVIGNPPENGCLVLSGMWKAYDSSLSRTRVTRVHVLQGLDFSSLTSHQWWLERFQWRSSDSTHNPTKTLCIGPRQRPENNFLGFATSHSWWCRPGLPRVVLYNTTIYIGKDISKYQKIYVCVL